MTGKVWVRFAKKHFFGKATPRCRRINRGDAETESELTARRNEPCPIAS
jgi:hypothetical protein